MSRRRGPANGSVRWLALAVALALPAVAPAQTSTPSPAERACAGAVDTAEREGSTDGATRRWAEAMEQCSSQLGPAHETTLRAKLGLAGRYAAGGQLERALALQQDVLATRRRTLGDGDVATLQSMTGVAILQRRLGQYAPAQALLEQVVGRLQATQGPRHAATLATTALLASVHVDRRQYGEAIALREAVLAIRLETQGESHADTLLAMQRLAAAQALAGRHENAAALQERVVAARRAALGEGHVDTLDAMGELATTYEALGRYGDALRLQRLVHAGRRAVLGPAHPDTLAAQNDLAVGLAEAGQWSEALGLATESFQQRRERLGPRHPSTLHSMNNLGFILNGMGRHAEALPLTEESLRLHREVLGSADLQTGRAMAEHATSLTQDGRFEPALALREEAFRLRQTLLGDEHADSLSARGNLASHYLHLGRAEKAIPLLEASLPLIRARWGPAHPNLAIASENLATAYGHVGDHERALRLQAQSVELLARTQGPDHPDTAAARANLALRQAAAGRGEEALETGRRALEWQQSRSGSGHPRSLHLMHNQAVLHRSLGQHPQALALANEAFHVRAATLGDGHPHTLASMRTVALILADLGLHDQAAAHQEQALDRMRARLGDEHADTLGLMQELGDSYFFLGQLDKALAHLPTIVARAEALRTQPELAPEQRRALFEAFSDRYQVYAARLAQAGRVVEAFDLGDLSKARSLTDGIRAQTALRLLPPAEREAIALDEARAREAAARLERLAASDTRDPAALLALQRELEGIRTAHRERLARLARQYPRYARLTMPLTVSSRDAGRWLAPGEVFISYLVQRRGSIQAFVLDASGQPRWIDLGPLPQLARSVAAAREVVAPSNDDSARGQLVALGGGYEWLPFGAALPPGARTVATTRAEARRVLGTYWHDALVRPLLPLVGGYRRWIVSPDKELALLPLDTIPDAAESGAPQQPLVHTRQISLVQSFSVFTLLKEREAEHGRSAPRKTLLAVGNPVYDAGWSAGGGVTRASGRRGYTHTGVVVTRNAADGRKALDATAELEAMQGFRWQNLPGTAQELHAIARSFASTRGGDVDVLEGDQASEQRLLELDAAGRLRDYRYLLFSAHGYLADNPEHSALVLSRVGNPPGIDGYITAAEWPAYDLRSDLIVLSACDTGVGRTQAGESVMGLPFALFVAGNRNALLTLWPVDDDATAEFMSRFFEKVRSGLPQAEALTRTKREFTAHPRWSHPVFWAAFVLYGV